MDKVIGNCVDTRTRLGRAKDVGGSRVEKYGECNASINNVDTRAKPRWAHDREGKYVSTRTRLDRAKDVGGNRVERDGEGNASIDNYIYTRVRPRWAHDLEGYYVDSRVRPRWAHDLEGYYVDSRARLVNAKDLGSNSEYESGEESASTGRNCTRSRLKKTKDLQGNSTDTRSVSGEGNASTYRHKKVESVGTDELTSTVKQVSQGSQEGKDLAIEEIRKQRNIVDSDLERRIIKEKPVSQDSQKDNDLAGKISSEKGSQKDKDLETQVDKNPSELIREMLNEVRKLIDPDNK